MSNLCILILLFLSHYQSLCVEGKGKLCIESIIGNGSLKPLFTCWFTTYVNETRYRNAVMGYDNTFVSSLRAIQGSGDNKLFIDDLVDLTTAPVSFSVGLSPLDFVIPMVSVIDWLLDGTRLLVTLATQDDSTMCHHLYNQTCGGGGASSFAHFCEDDSFCNGEEVCASHNNNNNSCISNTPACIDQACSEDPPRCMPTVTPTIQPTSLLTSQPTAEPRQTPTGLPTTLSTSQPTFLPTVEPTNIPTNGPTIQPTGIPTVTPTTCPTAASSCFIYRPVIYAK